MRVNLALVVLLSKKILAFTRTDCQAHLLNGQGMFFLYAIGRSRSYTDATIPAMDFPEMLHNIPEAFYIGLGTNPLNSGMLAHYG